MDSFGRQRAVVRAVMDALNQLEQEGKLDDLIIHLMPTFRSLLPILTPYSGDDLATVSYENIPGPYKLSLFLLCAKKDGTFNTIPATKRLNKSRATGMFPPIRPQADAPSKSDQMKTIGKLIKDKFGNFFDETNDLEVGTSIYETWPEKEIDAIFLEENQQRPLDRRLIKRNQFWIRRSLSIVRARLDERWRDPENPTEFQGVLFPQSSLNPDVLEFPQGKNNKKGIEKKPTVKCETYVPPRQLQEETTTDEAMSKEVLFQELFSDVGSWEDWETAEFKSSRTAGTKNQGSTAQLTANNPARRFNTKEDLERAIKDSEDLPWGDRFSDEDSQQAIK